MMFELSALGGFMLLLMIAIIHQVKMRKYRLMIEEETTQRKQQVDKLYYLMKSQFEVMQNKPTQWEQKQVPPQQPRYPPYQPQPQPQYPSQMPPPQQQQQYPQSFDEILQ
jgi:hypothetical protein